MTGVALHAYLAASVRRYSTSVEVANVDGMIIPPRPGYPIWVGMERAEVVSVDGGHVALRKALLHAHSLGEPVS